MKRLAVASFVLLALAATADAQQPQRFDAGPNGNFAPGVVLLCLGADGVTAVPCSSQGVPLATQSVNPLRITHCKPNPLTGITPPLC
jgi:hypothetical protein